MEPLNLTLGAGGAKVEECAGPLIKKQMQARLEAIQALFREEEGAELSVLTKNLRAWSRSHLQEGDLKQLLKLAELARERRFQALVTIGIGGSDLSARVYHDMLNHPYHNLLTPEARGGAPEAYFTGDTFDPSRLHGLLRMLAARGLAGKTLFNVISKSGRTGETVATLMIIRQWLADETGAKGEAWRQQVIATTGLNQDSTLYNFHQQSPFFGNELMPVPDGVGGRFSAFSPVGLFFLTATAGPDETPAQRLEQALAGVKAAAANFQLNWDDPRNIAYAMARWLHLAEVYDRRGTLLFYDYLDNRSLGDWFVQLYEESVQERGQGLNVIAGIGPTSNHSILNGILNGPRDKVVWFLHWPDLGPDLKIPVGTGIKGELEAFEGLSMSQVQTASYRGTQEDLTVNAVPNVTLTVPKRDTFYLCQVMRLLMDMVAVKGRLQGLHQSEAGKLDPTHELTYLQDAVDGYKERTRNIAAKMHD